MEPRRVCKYFLSNNCRYGSSCHYAHERPLCRHYALGQCQYGESCHFSHQDPVRSPRSNGSDSVLYDFSSWNNNYDPSPPEAIESANEAKIFECGICFEVVTPPKCFGLLMGCDHVFCLSCISTWRKTHSLDNETTIRSCPVCRKESDCIIPSREFAVGDRKATLHKAYKERLARIPCRYFTKFQNCPFGNDCFYAHHDENGVHVHIAHPFRPRRRSRDAASLLSLQLLLDTLSLIELEDLLHDRCPFEDDFEDVLFELR